LLTQNGVDKTSLLSGLSEEEGAPTRRTTFNFVHRQLGFYQLLGKHRDLGGFLNIDWQLNTARIGRDQPDLRSIFYQENADGDFAWRSNAPAAGERLYSKLDQTDYGGGLDLTLKLSETASIKTGYMGRTTSRNFFARRFAPLLTGNAPEIVAATVAPPEQFLSQDNAGTIFTMQEKTQNTDAYVAGADLHAAYAMTTLPVLQWLRAVGGLRVEHFSHHIKAHSPFATLPTSAMMVTTDTTDDEKLSAKRTETDYLPAAGLIFQLDDNMDVRTGYGGTVGRPQIKELAPFVTQDYVRRRTIKGNPDLERTYIHNFDVRWELFPVPTQVFAVSVFYKLFEHPIEGVLLDQNANITYENIAGADNYGAELEARVGLDALSNALTDFSVLSNLALIRSQVRLSDEQKRLATSQERPLAGQSPYVANLGLGWEPEWIGLSAFCFYNVFGRRIADTGKGGVPDEYEEAFHSVEANVNYEFFDHLTVSVSGSNLLFEKERFTQGGVTTLEADKGATFGLSVSYKY
jgi:outer membrane receptor protein involved in Fe transport